VSFGDLIAAVGTTLAIIGIVATIIYGRKALVQNKRGLEWGFEAFPLLQLTGEAYHDAIEVRIHDQKVNDPHLVRLEIRNTGKADLESRMFDQNRPIQFSLTGSKYAHLIEKGNPLVTVTDRKISISPELLPSGERWTISFLTEGRAEVKLMHSYLANTSIREARSDTPSIVRTVTNELRAALIAGSASAIMGILVAIITTLGKG
jgi:hypothetical protein